MTWAVKVERLRKVYRVYPRPLDRVRELVTLGLRSYHDELVAVDDVSFEVPRGATLGIVGKNGAGKSTLLKIIAGCLHPTAGQVLVRGRVASILELGLGFQPALTGRQNIKVNALLLGLRPGEIEASFDGIARFSELGPALERPMSTYSSGMVARLAFSVLTAVRAEIIILDEALATGDVGFLQKGRELLAAFRRSGATVVLVSHDPAQVRTLCDHALWIERGRLRAAGDVDEVVGSYVQSTAPAPSSTADRGLSATAVLLRLVAPGAARPVEVPLERIGWRDRATGADLGTARPWLEYHMEISTSGCRENGLSADVARRGWGGVVEEGPTRARVLALDDAGVFLSIRTPALRGEGPVELALRFRDTHAGPLRLEQVGAGAVVPLAELGGAGDGAWREVACLAPQSWRLDTLPRAQEPARVE